MFAEERIRGRSGIHQPGCRTLPVSLPQQIVSELPKDATYQKSKMKRLMRRNRCTILALWWFQLQVKQSDTFSYGAYKLAQSCAFCPGNSRRACLPAVRGSATQQHLFSVNFMGDGGNHDQDAEDDDDLDFPTWARGLRSWPLYPGAKSTPPQGENEAFPRNSSKFRIPLANLINVEALLLASGEDTIDNMEEIKQFEFGTNEIDGSTPVESITTNRVKSPTPLSILPSLEKLGNWDSLLETLQRSITGLTGPNATIATETILKETTTLIEDFVAEASLAISPSTVQDLIVRASQTLDLEENANNFVLTAEKLARQQGLNVSEAAERARETTKYTTNLVKLANGVLVSGYVDGDQSSTKKTETEDRVFTEATTPLFDGFDSVAAISASEYSATVGKGAQMGDLAGAIYQDTIPRTHNLGHSIVANGTTSDVAWMVTDSLAYEDEFRDVNYIGSGMRKPIFVRTITIRGFDASDESVDRERLLNTICTANPATLNVGAGLQFHSGLLSIARDLYNEIVKYIDQTAPTHRIVLNGHSVGGSLSMLLLFLLTESRGAKFVEEKVLRVFTFGSPPVVKGTDSTPSAVNISPDSVYHGGILEALGLPDSIVYGYVQPWDPIIRLFTNLDPLYPLLDDLGEDGVTLYVSGPKRSLRPITRAIIESWEDWPRFRDTFRSTVNQNYTSVGTQHLLLPERVRYLSDRFVSVNVGVPPVETIVRISSKELLPALKATFPLDTFQISFVPTAMRSFAHHFYPAYGFPIVDYVKKRKGERPMDVPSKNIAFLKGREKGGSETNGVTSSPGGTARKKQAGKKKDWAGAAAQWILGDGM